ncbi:MAG TPA: MFS transporter [Acidimicrobiales bacterium]|nr:MFS transporter [Acidimicrobiales bacterium]
MEKKWWVLVTVCTGVFMLLLDITIVNVALPAIEHGFSASLSDLQWVISAYALTLAAFLLTAGSVADRSGRRLVFAVGVTCFTVASLFCGLASGTLFLIIARAAQGVGGAIMFATSLALLAEAFRGRDRGVAFGVYGAVTGAAVAVGPVLGGAITSGLSWRWIFFVNLPIGIFTLAVTVLRVPESKDPRSARPDYAGFVTFSLCLGTLVYGLIQSTTSGWGATDVVATLVASGALFAAFLLIEVRNQHPMLDLSLLRVPTFDGGLIAAFAISGSLFSLLTYLVIYLQDVLGFSPFQAGLRFLPLSMAVFFTAAAAGRATSHVPRKWLIAPGFVLVGVGLLLMRSMTVHSGWTQLLPGFIVAGVGSGLVNVPLVSTAVGVVHPSRAGMASGINSTLRQVGIATGVAALGTIFASQLRSTLVQRLHGTPLEPHTSQIAQAITSGNKPTTGAMPAALRHAANLASRQAFINGLDLILLIGAALAFGAVVASFLLVREKDFVVAGAPQSGAHEPAPAMTAV